MEWGAALDGIELRVDWLFEGRGLISASRRVMAAGSGGGMVALMVGGWGSRLLLRRVLCSVVCRFLFEKPRTVVFEFRGHPCTVGLRFSGGSGQGFKGFRDLRVGCGGHNVFELDGTTERGVTACRESELLRYPICYAVSGLNCLRLFEQVDWRFLTDSARVARRAARFVTAVATGLLTIIKNRERGESLW